MDSYTDEFVSMDLIMDGFADGLINVSMYIH